MATATTTTTTTTITAPDGATTTITSTTSSPASSPRGERAATPPAESPPPRKGSLGRARSVDSLTPRLEGRARGARRRSAETQLVLVSDPGQDLDDEMGFIMCKHLVSDEDVELLGVVTTLSPSFERARLCRGTLDMLGMHAVPVGVGSDGGDTTGQHSAQGFKDLANSYLPPRESEQSASLQPGQRLLYTLWKGAAPKSLTLSVIASLKDAAIFLRDNEKLFVEKTKEVVIMGGVEAPEAGATLVPDSAHNNQFDRAASEFFYAKCQELGVRLIVVSRWAAYAVPVRANTNRLLHKFLPPILTCCVSCRCKCIHRFFNRLR